MSHHLLILLGDGLQLLAAAAAGVAAAAAGWLSWRALARALTPRGGAHAAGPAPSAAAAGPPFYGSMSLADEVAHRARFVPGEPSHVRDRETAPLYSPGGLIAELLPEAIAEGEPDAPFYDGRDGDIEEFDPAYQWPADDVPGPDVLPTPSDVQAGPGHPADLLSQLSDEDFWMACRFELRRLAWMAWEPLQLPAWTGRAAA